ncbi:MAG: divergent polysaccharide deacetylase family protein [Thermoanaerobaculia bacterium]
MSARGGVSWPWVVAVAVLFFISGAYLGRVTERLDRAEPEPQRQKPKEPEAPVPIPGPAPAERAEAPTGEKSQPVVEPGYESEYPPAGGARISLLIDDLGRSVTDVDTLQQLGVPISYAVLPFESRTPEVIAALREHEAEILCHLPMVARNGANPGPGALSREMAADELTIGTRVALEKTPGAVGVNNHMGSDLSADPAAMRTILEVLAESGLFYVDSRTSADSVGYQMALEVGVPAAERQVFLDSVHETETVKEQFRRLLEVARERGAAIAIGHPSSVTLGVLEQEIPRALAAGYEFVPVSYLLDRTSVQLQ